jgi:hypothetical protein
MVGADIVQRADVGMIQRCDSAGLALEAITEFFLRDLDCDYAIEPGIASLPHFSHAACTDRRKDFIRAESLSCRERHMCWFSTVYAN